MSQLPRKFEKDRILKGQIIGWKKFVSSIEGKRMNDFFSFFPKV